MWIPSLIALLLAVSPEPPASPPPARAEPVVYCDEDTVERPVFKRPEATHFVVADFRPRSERSEDISMGRTAANAVDRVLRDHMLRVALEGEEPPAEENVARELEVYRLRCVVKDATAARLIGRALGADLLLWGDAVCPLRGERGQPVVNIITTIEARDHARIQTGPIENHVILPREEVGSFCARAALTARDWPLLGSTREESRSASVLELGSVELPQVVSGDALGLTLFVGGLTFYRRQDYPRALRLFRRASESLRTDSASAAELLWAMGITEIQAGRFDRSAEYLARCEALAKEETDSWWNCRQGLMAASALSARRSRVQELAADTLQRARKAANRQREAHALSLLGALAQNLSEVTEARARFSAALSLLRALGDRSGEASTLMSLGAVAQGLGEMTEARAHYNAALYLFRATEDRNGEADTLLGLGSLAERLSKLTESRARLDAALSLYRTEGNRLGSARALLALANLALRRSDVQEARARYDEALPLFQAMGDRDGEAVTLLSLGKLAERLSDMQEARSRYDAALVLFRAANIKLGEAHVLQSLGNLAEQRSEVTEAQARYEEALLLFRATGYRLGEADTLVHLGKLAHGRSEVKEAQARYDEALRLFRAMGDRMGEAKVLMNLGSLAQSQSEMKEARARYDEALRLFRATQERQGEASTLLNLGRLAQKQSEAEDAQARYDEALPLFRAIGDRSGEANTLVQLAELAQQRSEMTEAEARYEEALSLYRAVGNRLATATTLVYLGMLEQRAFRFPEARARFVEAMLLFQALGDRDFETSLRNGIDILDRLVQLLGDRARREKESPPATGWPDEPEPENPASPP